MADTGATAFDIEYFAFKKKQLTDIRPVPLKTRWLTPAGLCVSIRTPTKKVKCIGFHAQRAIT
jgi:hypothetical protein